MQTTKTGGQFYGVLAAVILFLSTCLHFIPILCMGILKLIPIKSWQVFCTKCIDVIASNWCSINNLYVNNVVNPRWEISGLKNFDSKKWYLVVANHQSFLDIVILQRVFNRKIPVLKFFIKDQLKWVPLMGFAWWAMGCPFMKRYSKEYLIRNPHKKGKDIIATCKAIEKFKTSPGALMSFIEGTRFTEEKQKKQKSPHNHLLKPKAGGISFVISAMGQQIGSLLDVTIVYPQKQHTLWDFLCRRIDSVTVVIRELPIPSEFASSKLIEHSETQHSFKKWLNEQWCEKDRLIASLK